MPGRRPTGRSSRARSPDSAASWPTSTRCCSPTRTPITPGSPSGPAQRPAPGSGSTAPTRSPRGPARRASATARITSYLLRAAFYRTTLSLLRRGGGRMIPIAEVSAFADGEQIDVPGRPRAVHAPGHTAGQRGAPGREPPGPAHRRRHGHGEPAHRPVGPQIMPSGLNANTGQALASLDALLGIDADLLLPGHGDPWTQGVAEAVRRPRRPAAPDARTTPVTISSDGA